MLVPERVVTTVVGGGVEVAVVVEVDSVMATVEVGLVMKVDVDTAAEAARKGGVQLRISNVSTMLEGLPYLTRSHCLLPPLRYLQLS